MDDMDTVESVNMMIRGGSDEWWKEVISNTHQYFGEQLPLKMRKMSLKNYDWAWNNKHNSDAYLAIIAYSEKYTTKTRKSLFISGDIGTGKTHLMIGIVRKGINQGVRPYFITQMQLNDAIRHMFSNDQDLFEPYLRAQRAFHLIIDDLGDGRITDTIAEYTESLIKDRLEQGRLTHITTNYSGAELSGLFSKRLIDRFRDYCEIIELRGQSYRGSNKSIESKKEN